MRKEHPLLSEYRELLGQQDSAINELLEEKGTPDSLQNLASHKSKRLDLIDKMKAAKISQSEILRIQLSYLSEDVSRRILLEVSRKNGIISQRDYKKIKSDFNL